MNRWILIATLAALLAAGCSKYRSNPDECQSQADCNPGKTCGDMVQCVDGECDEEAVVDLPCDELCQTDADCPEGMHCRRDLDGEGECVADGTCADVSECADLPHDACLGGWACESGACVYTCQDLTACSDHEDCVLADADCCCGFEEGDYVAIRADKRAEWEGREECREVYCPEIACSVPATIAAACVAGECQVTQVQDLTACNQDSDCTVVNENCCGCFDSSEEPYRSIRVDQLEAWWGREECADILCEECYRGPDHDDSACWFDTCVRAVCRYTNGPSGHCGLDWANPFACQSDADCVKAELACPTCGCDSGYYEGAVNGVFEDAYALYTDFMCMAAGACQMGPFGTDACTDRPAVCGPIGCDVLGQTCDCPDVWAPVCVLAPNDAVFTFPNHCQAECAWGPDPFVVSEGRCECMVDCDCFDEYDCQACAANGQTYACSYSEIECNGLYPLYPGACDPGCDYCSMLDRMPIPACGADFYDYADICYNQCLNRDYWHTGACEPNEGLVCATPNQPDCPSEDLFCLVEEDVPGAQGRCIKLGACLEPAHCEGQPLAVDPCVGHFECPDHECVFICD